MSERYQAKEDKLEECYDASVHDMNQPKDLQVIAVCPTMKEAVAIADAMNFADLKKGQQ